MSKRDKKKNTQHKEHINKYANVRKGKSSEDKKQGSKKDWENFAREQANYGLENKAQQVWPQDAWYSTSAALLSSRPVAYKVNLHSEFEYFWL